MLEQAAQRCRLGDERVAQAAACAAHRRVAPPQQPLQSTASAADICHVVCLGVPAATRVTSQGNSQPPPQHVVYLLSYYAQLNSTPRDTALQKQASGYHRL